MVQSELHILQPDCSYGIIIVIWYNLQNKIFRTLTINFDICSLVWGMSRLYVPLDRFCQDSAQITLIQNWNVTS